MRDFPYQIASRGAATLIRIASLRGSKASTLVDLVTTTQANSFLRQEVCLGTIRSRGTLARQKLLTSTPGSKVLTIIGSGPSLKDLTREQQEMIEQGHVMTFNLSIMFPVRSDYHVLQCPLIRGRNPDSADDEFWRQFSELTKSILVHDYARFRRTRFLCRVSRTLPSLGVTPRLVQWIAQQGFDNQDLPLIYNPKPFTRPLPELLSAYLRRLKFEENCPLPIIKLGSTLPTLILLGGLLGYTDICLAGCDFEGTSHFYDDKSYREKWNIDGNFKSIWHGESTFSADSLMNSEKLGTTQLDDVRHVTEVLLNLRGVRTHVVGPDSPNPMSLPVANLELFT